MDTDAVTVPPAPRLTPGEVVGDRYRVVAPLGGGAIGEVYQAEHVAMQRTVALKVLRAEWAAQREIAARFEREAIAAGRIAHPNVAAATDFGRLDDGSCFLVLEYVDGRTLRSELDKGAFEPVRALRILRGLAAGVASAHALGIVHRDLKPENVVLVQRDGDPDFPKILDFGIAKLSDPSSGSGATTTVGTVLGTPDYMAPEQAMGEAVDERTDLYALGVILYELLTGTCPFRGGPVAVMRQHVMQSVPPLPTELVERLSAPVEPLLQKLLAKEPGARFATATELLAALDGALAQAVIGASGPLSVRRRTIAAPSSGRPSRLAIAASRSHARVLLLGLLGLIVLLAALLRYHMASSDGAGVPHVAASAHRHHP